MPETEVRHETPLQEVARLRRIVNHLEKLSPAGRDWLLGVLLDKAGMVAVPKSSWRLRRDFHVVPDLTVGRMREQIHSALDELGVPTADYPAPVANAVRILREAVG